MFKDDTALLPFVTDFKLLRIVYRRLGLFTPAWRGTATRLRTAAQRIHLRVPIGYWRSSATRYGSLALWLMVLSIAAATIGWSSWVVGFASRTWGALPTWPSLRHTWTVRFTVPMFWTTWGGTCFMDKLDWEELKLSCRYSHCHHVGLLSGKLRIERTNIMVISKSIRCILGWSRA